MICSMKQFDVFLINNYTVTLVSQFFSQSFVYEDCPVASRQTGVKVVLLVTATSPLSQIKS